jgi:hypothetical protein
MDAQERLRLAESFLQEAVFESRAKQAAGTALFGGGASCGLGARAEVVLALSPRAAEFARALWPRELSSAELDRVRDVAREWVESQDALDRKRNHFLKDFRQRHGFDRSAYAAEQHAEFDSGLERINAEVTSRRRAAAERLP